MRFHVNVLLLATLLLLSGSIAMAQGIDPKPPFIEHNGDKDDPPATLKEKIEKLRIEKEEKDYHEMLSRSEEASKLSDEVEQSFIKNGKLSDNDVAKVAKIEKLVKKIREELGGNDDQEKDADDNVDAAAPKSTKDAIETLKARSASLCDQLKKTTRFSISAAAIYSTNTLLRLTKMLRLTQ